jgi:chemotaxis protein MotB
MARRRHHEEHENHERWLVSYADFITLLFAFFVVMYAVSSVNEGKMRVLSDSLIATFHGQQKSLNPLQMGELVRSRFNDNISTVTTPAVPSLAKIQRHPGGRSGERDDAASRGGEPGDGEKMDVAAVADAIEATLKPLIDEDLVVVRRASDRLEVELNTQVLFASGEARPSDSASSVIQDLAGIVKQYPNPIEVQGFTDDIPIKTALFSSNWELSAARAASVVRLLSELGIDPYRLRATGYGEYQPVADNSTAEGRRKNRRVVIVIASVEAPAPLPDIPAEGVSTGPALSMADEGEVGRVGTDPAAKPIERARATEL